MQSQQHHDLPFVMAQAATVLRSELLLRVFPPAASSILFFDRTRPPVSPVSFHGRVWLGW